MGHGGPSAERGSYDPADSALLALDTCPTVFGLTGPRVPLVKGYLSQWGTLGLAASIH